MISLMIDHAGNPSLEPEPYIWTRLWQKDRSRVDAIKNTDPVKDKLMNPLDYAQIR
jgi:hypothetical protein